MRVISGLYKGRKLDYDIIGTRPTMDRVKESMFGLIQDYIKDSVVLDLFAGCGSLGIEALSNGCKKCYFVDKNREAIKIINKNLKDIENAIIVNNDCFNALNDFKEKFDIIFLDPPYHENLIEKVIDKIIKYDLLNDEGFIVCEVEDNFECSLELIKEKSYGIKMVKIYKKV